MTDDLARMDAVAQAALVRDGEVTPVELVQASIDRIEALDPQLNAVIHRRFEQALAEAEGELPDGPFRGVPFLIKDLWPTSAGDPLHMGTRGLKEAGYVHPTDSNLTRRYREAGFVVLGRTNTPELGLVATTEPLAHGPSRNPWNTDHGTGGSSGGAAAAVASGMVPAANASDGGGSIRIPAAMCGLVGLKPSRGRGSMGPLRDEWGVSVQHAVTHTVRDTAAILDVSWPPFPGDGVIAPPPVRPYADEVGAEPGRLRIGLLDHSLGSDTDAECTQAARDAAVLLESLGHEVVESHPAVMDRADEFSQAFMANWAVGAAASLVSLEPFLGRPFTEDDVEPGTWALAEMGRAFSGADLAVAQGQMHVMRRDMSEWWAVDGFDLLLTPTTAAAPPRVGALASSEENPLQGLFGSVPYAAFTSPFNTTGQPAISLPTHLTADGLPVGVQLVAAYGREDVLIRVAAQAEAEVGWAATRAPLHV
jgi:amidase